MGRRSRLGSFEESSAATPRRTGLLQRVERLALERPLAGQRLPQRDAERELIRRRADVPAFPLLGRHVRRRAEHRAGPA